MTAEVTAKAGRREWAGLGVLSLSCLLLALDLNVLHLALPSMSADLRPNSSQLLWIVDVYGFLIAGFLLIMGGLGDRIGRRRLLLFGAAAFGAASVLAAYSKSAEMLIVARAVLGIAGATLMPSTLSLIRNMFLDKGQRTIAITVWMNSFLVGSLVGPIMGGALVENFWWGSVFLIGVPVMALLLVLGPLVLPEFRDKDAGQLDLISVLLSLLAVLPVVYGLKEIAKDGFSSVPVIVLLAGIAVGFAFVRRQRQLASPLLDLSLFSNRGFTASLTMLTLVTGATSGTLLFCFQFLQSVKGLSPFEAGLLMLPATAASILSSLLVPAILRKYQPTWVAGVGMGCAIAGFLAMTLVNTSAGLAILVVGSVILYVGLHPVQVLGTDLIVGNAPPERAGAASAMQETSAEFGMSLGVAVLGSIGTAVYRTSLDDNAQDSIPAHSVDAASESIGAAVSGSRDVTGAAGDQLADAARDAFTTALQTTAVISAGIVMVAAAVVITLLHRQPAHSEDSPVAVAPQQDPAQTSTP
ncbi:MFS transporter [Streptomyces sp. NPDC002845]